jgi:nitronate monooxygenase
MILDSLAIPVVLAPLAGGPSRPELTAAVSAAGGLGFLAAGYLSAATVAGQLAQVRELTAAPFGINIFCLAAPPASAARPDQVRAYAARLAAEARAAGASLGTPRFEDDDWAAKISLLTASPVPVVSFTFGCPDPAVIAALQAAGSEVWITVTRPDEAAQAAAAGADVLVVQGAEAGGHRGSFTDDPAQDASDGIGLLALLQLVRRVTALPLVAAGGIATGAGVAAVLAAGAAAAQLGTAFLRTPEAGTAGVLRDAVAGAGPTAMTRAFTGRLARGIRNRLLDEHSAAAPAAYPDIHHLTAPLRQAGRAAGDAGVVNLWAGQAHELVRDLPAADLVRELAADAAAALAAAAARLGPPDA